MREDQNAGYRSTPKRRRRVRRKPSKFAYFLLLLVVALCASVVCVKFFFKIDTISVSGNSQYSTAQVIGASGIKSGAGLMQVNKAAAVKKICSSLPFVADATIGLWPPSTVEIQITADTPRFVVKLNGKYIFADENLKVLEERTDYYKYKGVIEIDGAKITKVEVGSSIILDDKTQAATIETLSAAIKEVGISKITSLNVADSYQLSAVYDNRITVIIGTPLEADKKLEDAAAIIKSKIQLSDKGSLDVSAQNKRYTFSPS